jgi:hypothetical protein
LNGLFIFSVGAFKWLKAITKNHSSKKSERVIKVSLLQRWLSMVPIIISHEGAEPDPIHKWFSSSDLRKSEQILGEVLCFIDKNEVKTVNMIEEIIGCPHEERIDYPEGDFCPKCSYWKNRDRFSGEMLH